MSSLDLLAVIWNITLDSTETEQLRRSVPFTLGELTPHSVSTSLDGSRVFDFVEIRLPTMPGADCKEKDADILKVLLLHIRGYPHDDASFKVTEPFIMSTGTTLSAYARATFNARAVDSTTDFFPGLDRERFHRLFVVRDLPHRALIFAVMGDAATWHRKQIEQHAKERRVGVQHKDYSKELARCDGMLRSLQRLSVSGDICGIDGETMAGRGLSSDCPMQLGYADVVDLMHGGDCCRTCSKETKVGALVRSRCITGTISFKVRWSKHRERKNSAYPADFIFTGLLHLTKQGMFQSFFAEDLAFVAVGEVVAEDGEVSSDGDSDDPLAAPSDSEPVRPSRRDIMFNKEVDKSQWPQSVRQRMVYAAPLGDFVDCLADYVTEDLVSKVDADMFRKAAVNVTDDGDDDEAELQRNAFLEQTACLNLFSKAVQKIPFQRLFGMGWFSHQKKARR